MIEVRKLIDNKVSATYKGKEFYILPAFTPIYQVSKAFEALLKMIKEEK